MSERRGEESRIGSGSVENNSDPDPGNMIRILCNTVLFDISYTVTVDNGLGQKHCGKVTRSPLKKMSKQQFFFISTSVTVSNTFCCCREASVSYSLSSVGSPVSMAALTTFLAGVCLLPTRVLAYIQVYEIRHTYRYTRSGIHTGTQEQA